MLPYLVVAAAAEVRPLLEGVAAVVALPRGPGAAEEVVGPRRDQGEGEAAEAGPGLRLGAAAAVEVVAVRHCPAAEAVVEG